MRTQRGFTLIELMVVVAVLAIIATLAAPSFRDFILMQRLKSINAQLVTDLQYARSEAATRGRLLRLNFTATSDMTCYALFVTTSVDDVPANSRNCDCSLGANAACSTTMDTLEVRTAQVPRNLSVQLEIPTGWPPSFAFDPVTGGLMSTPADNPSEPLSQVRVTASIDSVRALRTVVNQAGRPIVCIPSGSTMAGTAC